MAKLTLPPDPKAVRRFWAKVDLDDPDGCWLWDAALQTAGYGNIWVDGTNHTAHKVAYVWQYGPVPEGMQLDHLCRERRCVRPDHLEPVTSRENSRRSPLTLNSINAAKTHCLRGHELEPDNLYNRADGKRQCRACNIAGTCANGHPLRLLAGRYWCPPCAVRGAA